MKESAIFLSELFFSYEDGASVLQNVDLEVAAGEFIGVVGPNGGGKTTFFKLLMGFYKPQRGLLFLFGKKPEKMRKKIGYVPQVLHVDRSFPITVEELVRMGALENRCFYPRNVKDKTMQLLGRFNLSSFAKRPFSSLSGGQAQRALLARALLSDPDLLLLDEATANVDKTSSQIILQELEALKGKKTILWITHDLPLVLERVDRILCIEKQVISLKPKEVCEHFALGLYHTPLLNLPPNHFKKECDVPHCIFPG